MITGRIIILKLQFEDSLLTICGGWKPYKLSLIFSFSASQIKICSRTQRNELFMNFGRTLNRSRSNWVSNPRFHCRHVLWFIGFFPVPDSRTLHISTVVVLLLLPAQKAEDRKVRFIFTTKNTGLRAVTSIHNHK